MTWAPRVWCCASWVDPWVKHLHESISDIHELQISNYTSRRLYCSVQSDRSTGFLGHKVLQWGLIWLWIDKLSQFFDVQRWLVGREFPLLRLFTLWLDRASKGGFQILVLLWVVSSACLQTCVVATHLTNLIELFHIVCYDFLVLLATLLKCLAIKSSVGCNVGKVSCFIKSFTKFELIFIHNIRLDVWSVHWLKPVIILMLCIWTNCLRLIEQEWWKLKQICSRVDSQCAFKITHFFCCAFFQGALVKNLVHLINGGDVLFKVIKFALTVDLDLEWVFITTARWGTALSEFFVSLSVHLELLDFMQFFGVCEHLVLHFDLVESVVCALQ